MQMPTRQSSSITSQMLMMSSSHAAQPQYSTASVYNSVPHVSHTQRSSGVQWKGTNFLVRRHHRRCSALSSAALS
ncbi:hypothetical protein ANCCEY_07573 [Ancylostoma ceylanicum]|uniref:Uncharacterized protein n=1 Tax=Ancylostoma ceylanicum TaxID=53326 RepID=A0A0D6M0C3_9BILA|nr:hypothetical protein ANCCEY_07573 [Ancylostoma ceylanicum]